MSSDRLSEHLVSNNERGYSSIYSLERCCWFLVLLGFFTQVNSKYAFPSYNLSLGFWGVYCTISKNGRATLG